jgi:hypothetical protein
LIEQIKEREMERIKQ